MKKVNLKEKNQKRIDDLERVRVLMKVSGYHYELGNMYEKINKHIDNQINMMIENLERIDRL